MNTHLTIKWPESGQSHPIEITISHNGETFYFETLNEAWQELRRIESEMNEESYSGGMKRG